MVLSNFLYRLINLARFQFKNQEELDRIKTNQGLIYFNSRNIDPELPFNSNGFSVFSQFDEDGLINALIKGLFSCIFTTNEMSNPIYMFM